MLNVLRAAFARSRHPMLIADDQRRWVTGNAAACELLGVAHEAVAWHTMDDFTPLSERSRLRQQWEEFLDSGEAEGRYQLYVAHRELFPVEFGAVANVLPGRHLALFIPLEEERGEPREGGWRPVEAAHAGRLPLTKREREIMMLAASGSQNAEMAQRLVLAPETIKSHIQNAMSKLGARTRAHAVAIALVSGQIDWSDDPPPLDRFSV
ncbi:MAG: helix-turn-helix transcriptional regulator [Actinomycetota bacterium]|nr:helix-turn-helix transcriptional regulator [Actinomycetota bacterium]